jgi:hypothetical protein
MRLSNWLYSQRPSKLRGPLHILCVRDILFTILLEQTLTIETTIGKLAVGGKHLHNIGQGGHSTVQQVPHFQLDASER